MNVLVIGGSGYLGQLVLPFLSERHRLRVLDLRPPSNPALEYIPGSVANTDALAEAVIGMDAVLFMAMGSNVPLDGDLWGRIESHADAFDVSVKGLYLTLYSAYQAGVKHAVYTSSMSIYKGNCLGRPGADEDTPPDADHPYALTKRLGEDVCRAVSRHRGMSVNALRLYMPVPEDRWREEAVKNQFTPWTTAEDTARAMLAALEYRDGFQAFTISGDYEQRVLNQEKAKRLLDWEPRQRLPEKRGQ
ncbi:hypothetical protein CCAX7_26370 [Capsulimonas corticalis]|uniref:Uncharacterized protein n=1 Tax=Capsulimonas corticalis TaxID=2219043 RepID=A0A402D6L0_9BACT|nr:NAD(P)-dependent oxidoreductase [Capsulimonas corticalis]BDI30586.1 hypothetical protein CCAX7_26370 [Capsulimonas corticalis]